MAGEAGKGHNKTLHKSSKYYKNLIRKPEECEHVFSKSTGLCLHCELHKDDINKD